MWSFETDAETQKELDWVDEFVTKRVEPLDFVVRALYDTKDPARNKIIRQLQKEVQERGLWACDLGRDLDCPSSGQVKLARMNEILGRAWPSEVAIGVGPQWPRRGARERVR